MKHALFLIGIMSLLLSGFGCDLEDLVNTTKAPDVGSIQTDAAGFVVQPLDTVHFWVEAQDPQGESLQYQWVINSGEIIGSSRLDQLTWKAPLKGGNYSLSVTVSNSSEQVTRTEMVRVPSAATPKVNIIAPQDNAYLVQHSRVTVEAGAVHENGLQSVQFWIDDQYFPLTPDRVDDNYLFDWTVDIAPGTHEIKILAVAQLTSATGADSVLVMVEGIVPGKQ